MVTIGPGDPVRLPSHGPESTQVALVTGPLDRTLETKVIQSKVRIAIGQLDRTLETEVANFFPPQNGNYLEAAVRESFPLIVVRSTHQHVRQAGLALRRCFVIHYVFGRFC